MSTRLWVRCYSWTWLDHLKANFSGPGAMKLGDNGIAGFWIHESFDPAVNMSRLHDAIMSCRSLGFIANPGLVWHMGSDFLDKSQRWKSWLIRIDWFRRAGATVQMRELQDSRMPLTSCDIEMYDSVGDKMPPIGQLWDVLAAADVVEPILAGQRIAFCPGFIQYPQNVALTWLLRRMIAMGEETFDLAYQVDNPARLTESVLQIITLARDWQRIGHVYMPCADENLARDWASPVRAALARALVDDAWLFLDASHDDAMQFGTKQWRERLREPSLPPDPAAMGQMAFDLNANDLPLISPCFSFAPTPGSIAPTFTANDPCRVTTISVEKQVLRFDPTAKRPDGTSMIQGFRASFSRQLSADYTLYYVGVPPQGLGGNDGTGWQLGPYRFTVNQTPKWLWGYVASPATNGQRHVICCEQHANGLFKILLDGVEVGSAQSSVAQPDGTMAIGNIDAMNSRPCKMDLERLTVFEGVDRVKSLALSRAYCDWYGIPWRGGV